jgi:hypothetical protein
MTRRCCLRLRAGNVPKGMLKRDMMPASWVEVGEMLKPKSSAIVDARTQLCESVGKLSYSTAWAVISDFSSIAISIMHNVPIVKSNLSSGRPPTGPIPIPDCSLTIVSFLKPSRRIIRSFTRLLYLGHDLSSLKLLGEGGAIYKDAQRGNVTRPAEDILGDGGMNSVRLR